MADTFVQAGPASWWTGSAASYLVTKLSWLPAQYTDKQGVQENALIGKLMYYKKYVLNLNNEQ